ncbi:unnamed protein product [Symbiodinium natans]|uniref:Uncharacterized protein n=1 Tax=Symbiodinium natans TaxID=878477 RepID=A0A812LEK5_9DINO|nr:unnamed protein product [Symbiodinium natans]
MAMTRFVLFMLLGWYLVPHVLAGKRGTSGTPHRNPNQQNLPTQRGTSSHGDAGQAASSSSGATNSRRAQSSGAPGTGNATTPPDLPWMVDKHACAEYQTWARRVRLLERGMPQDMGIEAFDVLYRYYTSTGLTAEKIAEAIEVGLRQADVERAPLGQQDLYQWAYARLTQLGDATLPPLTTDTGGHTSSSSGQGRGGSHVQSSGPTDSLYSGYETLTSDTHSSTERMIDGELWVRVEGVWCRAYERISDPIDTSRAPLIRSSFGLHYSTPSTAQPAPATPPREGRLCRTLREAYASPDAEMGNGSLPSNLSTLDRPATGSSPGVPVSGPTVPSPALQSHAAVGSPDSANNGHPSTDIAGPDAETDGSCNAAVGTTSLVSCQAPTVSFPRPDEATLEEACTSLYLDLLQAHERDPLAPFLLLLRFLPIEAIFDAVLAQCTTERQRIMVTNNILRLWHLASTDLPNDSVLARPRRGAASVSSQDTGVVAQASDS